MRHALPPQVRMLHQNLMRTISPSARVHAVDNVEAAVKYVDKMENCDTPVRLVLLDLNLDDLETAAGAADTRCCGSGCRIVNFSPSLVQSQRTPHILLRQARQRCFGACHQRTRRMGCVWQTASIPSLRTSRCSTCAGSHSQL